MDSQRAVYSLEGRVAVVTGGSRGLGREMVLGLARAGADVVIASRKADACTALAEEVREQTGRRAIGVGCHVGRWDECDALVDRALAEFGRVHVLINNAGMSPRYPSLEEVSEELWDKVLAVNLKGAFSLTARLGTHMAEGEGGSIVNVSSVAAVQPSPIEVPYGCAKAALQNLTLSSARVFAPKVRVNCIMPGPFMTDISKAWTPAMIEGLKQSVPLGRGGEAHEVVGAALYLASDLSSYTTGAILKIDGGAAYSAA